MTTQIDQLKNRIYYNLSQANMAVEITDDYAAWSIAEGVVHYYNDIIPDTPTVSSVNGATGEVLLNSGDISEAGNLYFTNARAVNAIKTDSAWNAAQWDAAYSWGDHSTAGYESASNKGIAGGYASLDNNGKVPSSQLPSFVDDVLEFSSFSQFPTTGESSKIYIATDTNETYRWGGSTYVSITSGDVSSVNDKTGVVSLDTGDIPESGNLYFTNARAISAIKSDVSWNASQWDTAFSWGDHSLAGYALASSLSNVATSGDYNDLINKPTLNASNWDAAYSWGDHSLAGYASASSLSSVAFSGSWSDILNKPSSFTPSAHTHEWTEINSKPMTATRWPSWDEVTSKPDLARREAYSKTCNTGWHTIATNTGNRCSAKFVVYERDSGSHQAVHFYAAHHYGNGNTITVHSNSSYSSGGAFRYIRLKEAGTYDGVMLQVYIDRDDVSGCTVVMYENDQENGWTLQDWLTTEPYANMAEAVRIELDKTMAINTTSPIYENNTRVYSPNNKPSWNDIQSKPLLNIGNWDAAYSWGDHSTAGYALASSLSSVATSGSYSDLINKPTLNITNWDTAFSWGDHSLAGYALASSLANVATSGDWGDITNKPKFATRWPTPAEIGAIPEGTSISSAENSDKLDNLDSTQFVRSDVDDEVDGIISHNNDVVMKGNKTYYGGSDVASADASISFNATTKTIDFRFMD